MGALQARLVFIAFAGLSVVIAYNAIYLQDGPHPAPFSADLKKLDAAPAGNTGSITRSRRSAALTSVNSGTIKAVQLQLLAQGYDPGPADGSVGPQTQAAIQAYQQKNNLSVGAMTYETVEKLGIRLR